MTQCNPEEYLEVAKEILNKRAYNNNQIYIRTAIGRAYYASFLVTREKLKSLGISVEEVVRTHEDIIDKIRNKDYGTGDLLDELREDRVKADYKLNEKITPHQGNRCIKTSETIIKRVKDLK